jgi:homoserine/homoserine lactone efflux protein
MSETSVSNMTLTTFFAFFAASWLISVSPGAGAVYAMSSGLTHGFKRGYVATIGLILGIWTLLSVVALGLGAALASSTTAFLVIKWFGVAYLLYLGVQQWRAPAGAIQATAMEGVFNWRALVVKGWAINATNPKGVLFMLAVVPQFLNPAEPLLPQYLIIGAVLAFTDLVVMAGYTLLAARVLRLLKSDRQVLMLNRVFGSLFIGAALLLAGFKRDPV